jgi:serine/threonine protein kinase
MATNDEIEGFQKEARSIAHLAHPHIVRVFDFNVIDDTPFLVMDYAPGGTLRQHHPKGTILPLPTVISYVKQVADALQYAHEKKLIHRDIKPENMLLGENQQVLLSDFGIALITQSTRYQNTQEVIGTAAYMAPEQLQGKPRRASDQYALGIVAYEWLSGKQPFHGSFTEIYSQHLFVPPPSLREKLPELPPSVDEVILKALAKDPQQRFARIIDFARAFELASQGVDSSNSPDIPTYKKPDGGNPPFLSGPGWTPLQPSQPVPTPPPPPGYPTPYPHVPFSATTPPVYSTPSMSTNVPPNVMQGREEAITPWSNIAGQPPGQVQSQQFPSTPPKRSKAYPGHMVTITTLAVLLLVAVSIAGIFYYRSSSGTTASGQTSPTPSLTPGVTPTPTTIADNNYIQATSGTPVLDDPLGNNNKGNGWSEDNHCVFSGGAYHVTIEQQNTFLVCYAHPPFSNFAFQVQMTLLKGDGGGIVFRTGGENAFGYRFFLGTGYFDLNYGNKNLASSASIKANLYQTYLLTAIARGGTISLYLDKRWVITVEDSTASSGGIGLMAVDFSNAADVVFRNAQVWNL